MGLLVTSKYLGIFCPQNRTEMALKNSLQWWFSSPHCCSRGKCPYEFLRRKIYLRGITWLQNLLFFLVIEEVADCTKKMKACVGRNSICFVLFLIFQMSGALGRCYCNDILYWLPSRDRVRKRDTKIKQPLCVGFWVALILGVFVGQNVLVIPLHCN